MKTYFCKRCGRESNYQEALRDGKAMFCYHCPTVKLTIAGWPITLAGAFILIMYYIYNKVSSAHLDISGAKWIFYSAGGGMILVGLLRILQQQLTRKKWMTAHPEESVSDDDEENKEQNPQSQGDEIS